MLTHYIQIIENLEVLMEFLSPAALAVAGLAASDIDNRYKQLTRCFVPSE